MSVMMAAILTGMVWILIADAIIGAIKLNREHNEMIKQLNAFRLQVFNSGQAMRNLAKAAQDDAIRLKAATEILDRVSVRKLDV